jgi:transposase
MAKHTTRRYQRVSHAQRVEVMMLNARGLSQRAISREMNLNRTTIQAIIIKWNQYHTVQDRPKIGGPHKLDDRLKRLLARKVQTGQILTATQLVQDALTVHGITISRYTAQKLLHELGLKARRTIKRPLLTREHKRRRLEFATAHRYWTAEDWKRVIFSDETVITARPSSTRSFVWMKTTKGLDPRLVVPTVQGGGSKIMTWACITKYGFHDMVLHEDTVNAERYIDTLREYLLPIINRYFPRQCFLFQQDGASVHIAHAVTEFLETENVPLLEWPPCSPDLNIIENVWHYLKLKLKKLRTANSRDELWDNVLLTMHSMWEAEMTKIINNLYESMPRRMAAVVAARGGNTKY